MEISALYFPSISEETVFQRLECQTIRRTFFQVVFSNYILFDFETYFIKVVHCLFFFVGLVGTYGMWHLKSLAMPY